MNEECLLCQCGGNPELGRDDDGWFAVCCSNDCGRKSFAVADEGLAWQGWRSAQGLPEDDPAPEKRSGEFWAFVFEFYESHNPARSFVGYGNTLDDALKLCVGGVDHYEVFLVSGDPPSFTIVARGACGDLEGQPKL